MHAHNLPLDNMVWLDLSHQLSEHIPTWDATCGFKLHTLVDYHECPADNPFKVQKIEMPAGVGTHIDAPAHCIPEGAKIGDLSLDKLISPCVVIDVSAKAHEHYHLSVQDIQDHEGKHGPIPPHTFVIVHTGWSSRWDSPQKYRNDFHFPAIAKEAAQYLLDRKIRGLGVDTLSPDASVEDFPVHQLLLGAGRYIVENVAHADQMRARGGYALVMPMNVCEGTEAPVRLIGLYIKTRF